MVTGGEWKMAGTLTLSAAKGNNSKMLFHHLEEVYLSYSGDTVSLKKRQKIQFRRNHCYLGLAIVSI